MTHHKHHDTSEVDHWRPKSGWWKPPPFPQNNWTKTSHSFAYEITQPIKTNHAKFQCSLAYWDGPHPVCGVCFSLNNPLHIIISSPDSFVMKQEPEIHEQHLRKASQDNWVSTASLLLYFPPRLYGSPTLSFFFLFCCLFKQPLTSLVLEKCCLTLLEMGKRNLAGIFQPCR